jgi:hypothetical protein
MLSVLIPTITTRSAKHNFTTIPPAFACFGTKRPKLASKLLKIWLHLVGSLGTRLLAVRMSASVQLRVQSLHVFRTQLLKLLDALRLRQPRKSLALDFRRSPSGGATMQHRGVRARRRSSTHSNIRFHQEQTYDVDDDDARGRSTTSRTGHVVRSSAIVRSPAESFHPLTSRGPSRSPILPPPSGDADLVCLGFQFTKLIPTRRDWWQRGVDCCNDSATSCFMARGGEFTDILPWLRENSDERETRRKFRYLGS